MKVIYLTVLICTVIFSFNSISYAKEPPSYAKDELSYPWQIMPPLRELSETESKQYLDSFVNSATYALPYSEPLSVMLGSPELARHGLRSWAAAKTNEAWNDYNDALAHGANREQILRLMNRANRYQAIHTCLATGDCSRLRKIEAQDKEKRKEEKRKLEVLMEEERTNKTSGASATGYAEIERGGVIKVTDATYGWNCRHYISQKGKPSTVTWNNALKDIAYKCNGRRDCLYTIYYKHYGDDPAFGCEKDFRATYICTLNREKHEIYVAAEAGWGPERKTQTKKVSLSCH